jgi:antitoxin CptB
MPASRDQRRKRLLYRSRYTGCKELDTLLGPFAERHLDSLSEVELAQYETLLSQPEPEIYAWLSGRQPAPAAVGRAVAALLHNTKTIE